MIICVLKVYVQNSILNEIVIICVLKVYVQNSILNERCVAHARARQLFSLTAPEKFEYFMIYNHSREYLYTFVYIQGVKHITTHI